MTTLLLHVCDYAINGCVFLLGAAVFWQTLRPD